MRRHRPIRIEPIDFQSSAGHLVGEVTNQFQQIVETDDDDNNLEEVGQIIHHRLQDVAERIPDETHHSVSNSLRLWEEGEHEAQSHQHHQQDEQQTYQVEYENDGDAQTMRVEQGVILDDH